MDHGHRACRRRRTGAAFIESSLMLLLFLMTIFGIFDFAFITFQHETLLHQVRSAARFGAVASWACESDDCIDEAAVTAVRNVVMYGDPDGGANSLFGLTPEMVKVAKPGKRRSPDEQIVVTLEGYRYMAITPLVAGWYTGRPITVALPMEEYAI
jgi:hypothetical protein